MRTLNQLRELVESSIMLRSLMNEQGGDGFSMYGCAKDFGLSTAEVNTLRKMNIIKRSDHPVKGKLYAYSWIGREPSVKMMEKMVEEMNNNQRLGSLERYQQKVRDRDKKIADKIALEDRMLQKGLELDAMHARAVTRENEELDYLSQRGLNQVNYGYSSNIRQEPVQVEVITEGQKKIIKINVQI